MTDIRTGALMNHGLGPPTPPVFRAGGAVADRHEMGLYEPHAPLAQFASPIPHTVPSKRVQTFGVRYGSRVCRFLTRSTRVSKDAALVP